MGGSEFLVLYAVSAVLLVASSFLLKPKTQKSKQDQDIPTTLTRRGAAIPYLFGKGLVSPAFCWADDAGITSQTVRGSGGGKGVGGSGSANKQTVYFSAGWHVLCPGPASHLEAILEAGKEVWRGNLTRDTTPSGSVIDAGNVGIFQIFWGEFDQPVSATLQGKMKIGSRWPGVCHIVWIKKALGSGTTWPILQYLMRCEFESSGSLPTSYMIDDGIARGVNGACALFQLLSGRGPYGLGIPASKIDEVSLLEVADLCSEEHLPANFQITDGEAVERPIQGILGDLGVMMSEHEGLLFFRPVREPTSIAPFNEDITEAPDLEKETVASNANPTKIVYTFLDENYAWRQNDVKFDNDATLDSSGSYDTLNQELYIPTHKSVAARIGNRRIQEAFGSASSLRVRAMRGATLLKPGDSFSLPAYGTLRVTSKELDTFSATCVLGCYLDAYGVAADYELTDEDAEFAALPAQDDLAVAFFDVPSSLSGITAKRITVFRIRDHQGISGAKIWISADGGSYELLGIQAASSSGGPLLNNMSGSGSLTLENGPRFESFNQDSLSIRDLSADEASWQSGSQLALIQNELFYLREVELQAVSEWEPSESYSVGDEVIPTASFGFTGWRYVCVASGNSAASQPTWPTLRLGRVTDGDLIWEARGFEYQLKGLIRARAGTQQSAHPAASIVHIISESSLTFFGSSLLQEGVTLCMKTQPFTSRDETSLSATTPVCSNLQTVDPSDLLVEIKGGSILKSSEGETISIGE